MASMEVVVFQVMGDSQCDSIVAINQDAASQATFLIAIRVYHVTPSLIAKDVLRHTAIWLPTSVLRDTVFCLAVGVLRHTAHRLPVGCKWVVNTNY